MKYRKFGDALYIRMDKDDEIIEEILKVCKKEKIRSCVFSGIGGCSSAQMKKVIIIIILMLSLPIRPKRITALMQGI